MNKCVCIKSNSSFKEGVQYEYTKSMNRFGTISDSFRVYYSEGGGGTYTPHDNFYHSIFIKYFMTLDEIRNKKIENILE